MNVSYFKEDLSLKKKVKPKSFIILITPNVLTLILNQLVLLVGMKGWMRSKVPARKQKMTIVLLRPSFLISMSLIVMNVPGNSIIPDTTMKRKGLIPKLPGERERPKNTTATKNQSTTNTRDNSRTFGVLNIRNICYVINPIMPLDISTCKILHNTFLLFSSDNEITVKSIEEVI